MLTPRETLNNYSLFVLRKVTNGLLSPDLSLPGFGLMLKEADMLQYRVYDTASESAPETARKKNR